MFQNSYMKQHLLTAFAKLSTIQIFHLMAQIDPSQVAQWLSVLSSLGVMLDTVVKWFVTLRKNKPTNQPSTPVQVDNIADSTTIN